MTPEHRRMFDLSEIVALTFECTAPKCGIRLSIAPEKVDVQRLLQCPTCSALWLANDEDIQRRDGGAVTVLLRALRAIRGPNKETPSGFRLFFEFADAE